MFAERSQSPSQGKGSKKAGIARAQTLDEWDDPSIPMARPRAARPRDHAPPSALRKAQDIAVEDFSSEEESLTDEEEEPMGITGRLERPVVAPTPIKPPDRPVNIDATTAIVRSLLNVHSIETLVGAQAAHVWLP